ncbi:hypothetical protein E4Z66_17350 [Aliishimia ponticola]|uniref:Alpha/beta hydrolase n=1 Tax=Aliishimia ponticola TaxID=2499833 RepID=A0A4S4N6H2_9RHOB|nr:hypothetical protein [Aliishimia ponticola]THH34734.1 hypothetical protein E4Z66_17350 [Aliishimia ponticola]
MRMGVKKQLRQLAFRLASRRLFRDADVDVSAIAGRGTGAMVVFTSFHGNAAKRGLLEFAGSASAKGERHCIFVTDRRQGWFQAPGIAAALLRVIPDYVRQHGITRLMTLGVSMGGYGALSFARDLGADSVLALAPQYSPKPQAFPADMRWIEARSRIAAFTRPDLTDAMGAGTAFTVLHGRASEEDALHVRAFPEGAHIDHYLADGAPHDVIDPLRNAGALYPLIEAVWQGKSDEIRALMQRISAVPRARTLAGAV